MVMITLIELYELLKSHFGPQNWWPGETQDEIVIGAILTQSVAWKNVEKAIVNLKSAGITTMQDVYHYPVDKLALLIRPSLYYNQKAIKLKNFAAFFVQGFQADYNYLFSQPLTELRSKLLQIKGLGQETVDSILLYAGGLPIFVCDAYTNRLMLRLGYATEPKVYDYWQRFFMDNLPCEVPLYNDFHAQIVVLCKDICKPVPRCGNCPLEQLCPANGL